MPSDGPHNASHRVIADHLRASAFLIADGVLPSNEGRGYVLRRIMRRAMRHAELLGAKDPLMWQLVPVLTREMGQAYPELLRAEALIGETLKLEETRFRATLARGLAILDEKSAGLKKGAMFDGETAFTLYDTYGFPLDLTQDALRARGISVDLASFDDAMERQRAKARASWSGSGEAAAETIWFGLREKVGATEFLGYETESAEGVVAALVKDGKQVPELKKGESGAVVMNQTPFYAESGGQVGDTGQMRREGVRLTVTDTQKKAGDLFVHLVKVEEGTIKAGDPLLLVVDHDRRAGIRANHSATHLLHEALRQVLGDHVAQKGSLVAPDRLRFDFSHPKPMTAAEIETVEDVANDIVLQNAPVTTRLMPVADARASGAVPCSARNMAMRCGWWRWGSSPAAATAGSIPWSSAAAPMSGGPATSARSVVTAESASAAGVRRIEALAGKAARKSTDNAGSASPRLTAAETQGVAGRSAGARRRRCSTSARKLERELSDARKKSSRWAAAAEERWRRRARGRRRSS